MSSFIRKQLNDKGEVRTLTGSYDQDGNRVYDQGPDNEVTDYRAIVAKIHVTFGDSEAGLDDVRRLIRELSDDLV